MPTFDIIKINNRENTFRTQSISDRYELHRSAENVRLIGNIDIESHSKWNVGLIVGLSGSGKSTIAKQVFKDNYIDKIPYSSTKAIIDEMPENKSIDDITTIFNSCGLGTVWTWLKPYQFLSTGEKMRCDIARVILEDRNLIVFDEFTSVVDRNVAKLASNCISKTIKKNNKKFVAVSCHRDIIEWLEPDWIYDTDSIEFFFVQENSSALNVRSQYFKQISNYGSILKNFTI